jgi:hypothetical protein
VKYQLDGKLSSIGSLEYVTASGSVRTEVLAVSIQVDRTVVVVREGGEARCAGRSSSQLADCKYYT